MSWQNKLRGILVIMILVLLAPVLNGCWDKIEVRELGIVMGMGLDLEEGNEPIQLTLQTVKPNGQQNGGEGNGGSNNQSKQHETLVIRGQTVYDAFQNIQKSSNKKIILPHSKLIVVGKKLAVKGLSDVSDYLLREREIRPTSWIVVAESTARELLESQLNSFSIPAAGLVTMMEELKATSMAHPNNLYGFFMQMQGDAQITVAPIIQKVGKDIRFESTAVFHKDRMIGSLTVNETRGLLWLENKLVKGNVTMPYQNESSKLKKNVSIEINNGNTKITPRLVSPDEITMDIQCSGLAQIRDAEVINTMLFKPEAIEDLEKAVEEFLVKRIQHTVDVAQKEMKADFIGFEDTFHNAYPAEWKRLHKDWDELFPSIKTVIKVDIEIYRQGITKNPLEL